MVDWAKERLRYESRYRGLELPIPARDPIPCPDLGGAMRTTLGVIRADFTMRRDYQILWERIGKGLADRSDLEALADEEVFNSIADPLLKPLLERDPGTVIALLAGQVERGRGERAYLQLQNGRDPLRVAAHLAREGSIVDTYQFRARTSDS